jgi:hypothetical protein
MNSQHQPPGSAPEGAPVHPPIDLAALLEQPYRAGDAAYAAALWRATVQRLATGVPSQSRRPG